MSTLKSILSLLFVCVSILLSAQVVFKLAPAPGLALPDSLYLAHNFNHWQAGDETYRFKEGWLSAELAERKLLYKVCGSSWAVAEAQSDGQPRPNRTGYYQDGDTVVLRLLAWESKEDVPPRGVQALHGPKELYFKGTERKLWIYLPKSYPHENRSYPVLYLHDAQNLFRGLQGSAEKWQVAQCLDSMNLEMIVVGINHGGEQRIAELSPFSHPQHGGGAGAAYLTYLTQNLKPYVDAHFRTLPEREHCYLGGSSLGGLISLYGLLQYPEQFGGGLIFSPAYWFNPELKDIAQEFQPKKRTFVYHLVGDDEGGAPEEFVQDFKAMEASLLRQSAYWKLQSKTVKGGQHHERMWQKQLPTALKWLHQETPFGKP